MEKGYPEKYEIFPTLDRLKDVGQRIGRFLLPQKTEVCLSEHIKHEPTDGEAIQPQLPFEDGRATTS
jgi:hypothetical protein